MTENHVPQDAQPRPIIIGAGATGLSAAYQMAKMNLNPIVFEAAPTVGGLAGDFDLAEGKVEKFYHHWFGSDNEVFDLVRELGLGGSIVRRATSTGMYYSNQIFKLSSPLDLLRYSPLRPFDRLRLGLMSLEARRVKDWRGIEHLTAREWLIGLGGHRVYDQVWEPLLKGKFGKFADQVGASWMWTKLHLRGGSRGKNQKEELFYLHGGSGNFMETLARSAVSLGAEIRTDAAVDQIVVENGKAIGVVSQGTYHAASSVLSTVAPMLVAGMLGKNEEEPVLAKQVRELNQVEYLANVCVTLLVTESLSSTYWLNVADPEFPYVGVIEHTNMYEDPKWGSTKIVYLSKYLPVDDPMYTMSDEDLINFSIPHLKRMFPHFGADKIVGSHVWRAEHAQPIITPNYSRIKPAQISSVANLFMASMAHIFPEDRGVNYALKQGRELGYLVGERLLTADDLKRAQYV